MKIPLITLLWTAILLQPAQTQILDSFSDGDFLHHPAWSGDTAFFKVTPDLKLQSDGISGNGTLCLSTPHSGGPVAEWRFKASFAYAPSSSNYVRIYLASDKENLKQPIRGYYIRLGMSGNDDSIDLLRQDSSTETLLIQGQTGAIAQGFDMEVKVTRQPDGLWELFADYHLNGSFSPEGSAWDSTYSQSPFFGLRITHSSSRRDQFFFDDFYAGRQIVDTLAPGLDSLRVLSANELELVFSESLDPQTASQVSNYELEPAIGRPALATRLNPDSNRVRLQFAQSLANNTPYTLIIRNLADLAGNGLPGPLLYPFHFFIPDPPEFLSVVFNEVMPDPSPPLSLPEVEYIELFNRSGKYFSLEGWTLDNGTTQSTLPAVVLEPGGFALLCPMADSQAFQAYGPVTGLASWPALVNGGDLLTLRAPDGQLIDSLEYDKSWYGDDQKDDGGYALERIWPEPAPDCPPGRFWTASLHPEGGSPGKVNSVFSEAPDPDPPLLLHGRILSADSLELGFNEPMASHTLMNGQNYRWLRDSSNTCTPFTIDVQNQRIGLALSHPFAGNFPDTLQVLGLRDCWGNPFSSPPKQAFVRGEAPLPFEIILNEVLADYSPAVGLPEGEFVELYNRGPRYLQLQGFRLSNAAGYSGLLPSLVLEPESYLILSAPSDSQLFAPFGRVLPVKDFPSLRQEGEALFLQNSLGETLDYFRFDEEWFGSEGKKQGGWTLERVDPDFVGCNPPGSWRPSLDPAGGTPGNVNSWKGRFTDEEPPVVTRLRVTGSDGLELHFNEPMEAENLSQAEHFRISPGDQIPFLAVPIGPDQLGVELLLDIPLDSNTLYSLSYKNLEDCSGNSIQGEQAFGIPKVPYSGEVLVHEVLFNPASGGSDFVEIFNAGSRPIDLQELWLAKAFPGTDSVLQKVRIHSEQVLLLPGELLCLTSDIPFQLSHYGPPAYARLHTVPGMPNFPDDTGEILLLNGKEEVIDHFTYTDDMHYPGIKDKNGVSLERLSPALSTQDPGNWHSASSQAGFATPGYENSQRLPSSEPNGEVWLASPTFSPDGDGREDVLALHYHFSFPGGNARLSIYDGLGRSIRTITPHRLLGQEAGSMVWDGLDDSGRLADPGIYVALLEVSRMDTGQLLHFRNACVLALQF